MEPELWRRLRAAYDVILDAPAAARPQLLQEYSGHDPAFGAELARLLAADANPSSFLDTPVMRLAPPRIEPGGVLAGRFTLLRRLGQGGMGEVWAARDASLNDDVVALKMVRVAGDGQHDRRRFIREIQLARRISHPNVCRVYEFFEDTASVPPTSFLTMELIEGETLAARLKRGALPAAEALAVFRQVAGGLEAAHAAGVVHRDLKPANVMLVQGASARQAVVMDFGLARAHVQLESDGATLPGTLVGTPEYMAPEQVTGGVATPATDIYALGLMLFEMLRGTRPFESGSTLDSWMRRAREGPERLSGAVPGVQARVDGVIRSCLEYEASRRPQSIADLLAALDTSLYIPVPRGRGFWAAVAAAVVTLAAGGGLFVWNQTRPARPSAEAQEWYEEAQQALAEGATVRALRTATRATRLAPQFAPAHLLLGEINLELDMPARAQQSTLRAQELARTVRLSEEDEHYLSGIQALLLHRCDEVAGAFRRRIERAPSARRPFRMVSAARALERCGDADAAGRLIEEARALDPRNAAVQLALARAAAARRDYARASEALTAAAGLFGDRNNLEGRAEVLIARATQENERDQLEAAAVTLAEADGLVRSLDDVRQRIRLSVQQAVLARKRGEIAEASRITEAAIAMARQHDLEALALQALFAAGNAHIVRSEFPLATGLFERALAVADAYGHDEYRAHAWLSLASVFVPTGQDDRALKAIAAARPHYQRTRQVRRLAAADMLEGQVRLSRGEYTAAAAMYEAARKEARAAADEEQEIRATENLATALTSLARYDQSLGLYEQIERHFHETKQTRREVLARLNRADVLSRMGRSSDADAQLAHARRVARAEFELQSRVARVEADHNLRAGRDGAALAASQRVLAAREPMPPDRATRARLAACVSAARVGRHDDARRWCAEALAGAGPRERGLWLAAQLAAAEAEYLAHAIEACRARLADLSHETARLVDTEDGWRFFALSVLTAENAAVRQPSSEALTRELNGLRLKGGDGWWPTWRKRADVASLIGAATSESR